MFYNKDGLYLLTFLNVPVDVILLHTSYSGTQAEGAAPILAPEEKKQFEHHAVILKIQVICGILLVTFYWSKHVTWPGLTQEG